MCLKIVTEDKNFKWKLPKGMANCAKKYFEEIIPVKGMEEAILMQRVVPENKDI